MGTAATTGAFELGDTPLLIASCIGIRKILAKDKKLTCTYQNEFNLNVGHLEMIKCLVESGANIEQSNSEGWTVLHWTSRYGNRKCLYLK